MPRPVAVLFVHGIGVSTQDYAEPMIQRIRRRLPKAVRPHVVFGSAFWADIVRPHQRHFFQKAQHAADLRDSTYRRFALEGLGDAAAYQKTPKRIDAPYFKIQAKVRDALHALDVATDPARPLIVVGHSLGCHILSSFIWDVNSVKQYAADDLAKQDDKTRDFYNMLTSGSPFRRLDTLAGIVTMGSNMPLFTFTFERGDVTPITKARPGKVPAFPGPGLSNATATKAHWINFYSRNDLLAYPLKPLYDLGPDCKLLDDVPVRAEGFWKSQLPSPLNAHAAHTGYERNRQVLRDTARLISSIAMAEDQKSA